VEGEGGLTAGRVSEAISMASTAQLKNVVFHIDWNEASIESERVTADGEHTGDYVQWTPQELFYIHDCNVIFVPNGHDFNQIHAAHQLAREIKNHQPTAIVYRTIKGWQYGLEGKSSHGSGHKYATPEFYKALEPFEKTFGVTFPRFEGDKTPENIEKYYWDSLLVVRQVIRAQKELSAYIAHQVAQAAQKLNLSGRAVRKDLGNSESLRHFSPENIPAEFKFEVGASYTTRGILGKVLAHLNKETKGTLFVASADLYGSTGAAVIAQDFDKGDFNAVTNPYSRRISAGGICEDGMAAVCSGISAFGKHTAVSSSYGAFVAFEHVAARLHAIGVQSAREIGLDPNTLILFNGHASLPTGEDGPTHADPQPLQLLQDNFPKGTCITATPLEVDEIWPLVTRALALKPAIFAPFVVRTSSKFMDRKALGADDASQAVNGVYYLRRAKGPADGTLFVQGAGVGRIIVEQVLPVLEKEKLNLNIIYITSRELFEMLPPEKQQELVPVELLRSATGITDFTLPTLDAWINSVAGRYHAIYPHKNGKFLQSAGASKVYEQAHMDGKSILEALHVYVADLKGAAKWQ
jgi:transketolase